MDLNSKLLPDSVHVDLTHGVLSVFLDFPDAKALEHESGIKGEDQLKKLLQPFVSGLVYKYAPQGDSLGYKDFDSAKPIYIQKVVLLPTPHSGSTRGQVLQLNVWFQQALR